jgi:molecular chaperone GrpE (heat shock protein)
MADDKVKKGPLAAKAAVDISIVDPKRIEELRAKAKTKIDKERQLAAEAQLLEQFEKEERQAGGLEEELEEIFIDLAPYADRLMLDGVVYFNGRTHTVRKGVADVMREMIQATWRHQSIVDGKPEDFYRKSRAQRVIPLGNGQAGVSNILRA